MTPSIIQEILCTDKFLDHLEFMLQDEKIYECVVKERGLLLTSIRTEVREYLASYDVGSQPQVPQLIPDSVNTYKIEALVDDDNQLINVYLMKYNAMGRRECVLSAQETHPDLVLGEEHGEPTSEESDEPYDEPGREPEVVFNPAYRTGSWHISTGESV